jgi:hypothetical protein
MRTLNVTINLLIVLALITASCKKEEIKPDITIGKVVIEDIMEMDYNDSILYAGLATLSYKVKFKTDPDNSKIYYNIDTKGFKAMDSTGITIDSNVRKLSYYAESPGYNRTAVLSIEFDFSKRDTIRGFNITMPYNSYAVYINYRSNQRGTLNFAVYSLAGVKVFTGESFITVSSGVVMLDLSGIQPGEYIIRLNFGESTMSKSITIGAGI